MTEEDKTENADKEQTGTVKLVSLILGEITSQLKDVRESQIRTTNRMSDFVERLISQHSALDGKIRKKIEEQEKEIAVLRRTVNIYIAINLFVIGYILFSN